MVVRRGDFVEVGVALRSDRVPVGYCVKETVRLAVSPPVGVRVPVPETLLSMLLEPVMDPVLADTERVRGLRVAVGEAVRVRQCASVRLGLAV